MGLPWICAGSAVTSMFGRSNRKPASSKQLLGVIHFRLARRHGMFLVVRRPDLGSPGLGSVIIA
jgi:hypothetical protein